MDEKTLIKDDNSNSEDELKEDNIHKSLPEGIISIESTINYGLICEDQIFFDTFDVLSDTIFDYKINKISVCFNEEQGIIGMNVTAKHRITEESICLVNFGDVNFENKVVFNFCRNELIINLILYSKEKIIGFKLITNKKEIMLGSESGSQISIEEFQNRKNIIIGLYGSFNEKCELCSLGCYYLSFRDYCLVYVNPILLLRKKLKEDEGFKRKKIEENCRRNERGVTILKTCLLPDNQFFNVLKFLCD